MSRRFRYNAGGTIHGLARLLDSWSLQKRNICQLFPVPRSPSSSQGNSGSDDATRRANSSSIDWNKVCPRWLLESTDTAERFTYSEENSAAGIWPRPDRAASISQIGNMPSGSCRISRNASLELTAIIFGLVSRIFVIPTIYGDTYHIFGAPISAAFVINAEIRSSGRSSALAGSDLPANSIAISSTISFESDGVRARNTLTLRSPTTNSQPLCNWLNPDSFKSGEEKSSTKRC